MQRLSTSLISRSALCAAPRLSLSATKIACSSPATKSFGACRFSHSLPATSSIFATPLRFCSTTGGSSLPPAPVPGAVPTAAEETAEPLDLPPKGVDPTILTAAASAAPSNATGLSEADKEIVRQAFELERQVRADRARAEAELAARAEAEGRDKWELEKEAAESGDLIRDKDRKDQMGGKGIGTKSGDMMAIFTCNVCEHRSAKRFSKHCYTKGIVIVQCPGCTARHLLADNMGWFVDEKKNIEDILAEKGEEVVRLDAGVFIETLSVEASTVATNAKGAV